MTLHIWAREKEVELQWRKHLLSLSKNLEPARCDTKYIAIWVLLCNQSPVIISRSNSIVRAVGYLFLSFVFSAASVKELMSFYLTCVAPTACPYPALRAFSLFCSLLRFCSLSLLNNIHPLEYVLPQCYQGHGTEVSSEVFLTPLSFSSDGFVITDIV